ncbi:hypothetical protein CCAX7_60260 [Capsulimonas corticalis]|uniref:Uncharacterized protein n=1 Tax=Capsulimonas corticalis TaxID=2219043 RepID=A0A402CVX8_9BACT|nr:hypothetical protein CCAX7_60260 [Capsulimonas corticalis]
MTAYIEISPRGFSNETELYTATPAQIAVALDVINEHRNAWARRVSASSGVVRKAKRLAEKPLGMPIPQLIEDVIRPFRVMCWWADGSVSWDGGGVAREIRTNAGRAEL